MNTAVGHSSTGLRERKKARTREALQEAATERFSRQGFDGTTVEEIAEACEVSPRTFFRYFPTKEDVLFADAAARRERLIAVIAERPVDEPAFGALRAAMRTLTADYRDDRDTLVTRSKIVGELAAPPGLQGRAPARLGGRGRRGARAARARAARGRRRATSCSSSPRSPPPRCASRSTRGWPIRRHPTSVCSSMRAFARLAAGFEPARVG